MTKRTFTKYPSSYVKASSDFTKRYYVYYSGDTGSTNLANAIINEYLEKYGAQVNFGYRDSRCRSYGPDVSVCIITSRKPIAKTKFKSIIEDELDVTVVGVEAENFN